MPPEMRQPFPPSSRRHPSKFEHRLFLSATPHNGHSNSFSSLLEIFDPQRFTRGVPVRAGDLDPIMVRRLKSDLKYFGETFPTRVVDPIRIAGLPEDSPDLALARLLRTYGEALRARAAALPPKQAGLARLAFMGLQQRLLSSPAAFAQTLAVHLRSLDRVAPPSDASALAYIKGAPEPEHEPEDEQRAMTCSRPRTTKHRRPQRQRPHPSPTAPKSRPCWPWPETLRATPTHACFNWPIGSGPTPPPTVAGTSAAW